MSIEEKIKGKTVKFLDCETSVNSWFLHFTDGTAVEIFAEQAIRTPFGNIPGLFIQEVEQEDTNK